jgi:hypothetical protein
MDNDVERGGVGAGPWEFVIGKPVDERSALRNLVRDLAVRTLELLQEFECRARRAEIALGVDCKCRPHCVATEEPGEAGPLAFA